MNDGMILVSAILFAVFVFVGLPWILKIFAWASSDRESNEERCDRALTETLKKWNHKEIKTVTLHTPQEPRVYYQRDDWLYDEDPSYKHISNINLYIERYKIEELMEYIAKVYNSGNPQEKAEKIHGMVEHAIYMLYPIRDYNEGYRGEIMELCELDLSIIDAYIDKRRDTSVIRTPTKYAILLEQARRYDEAIDLCSFCESRPEIQDYGYDSFTKRREHLERKRAKVHAEGRR
jgi:hypothetical protein